MKVSVIDIISSEKRMPLRKMSLSVSIALKIICLIILFNRISSVTIGGSDSGVIWMSLTKH